MDDLQGASLQPSDGARTSVTSSQGHSHNFHTRSPSFSGSRKASLIKPHSRSRKGSEVTPVLPRKRLSFVEAQAGDEEDGEESDESAAVQETDKSRKSATISDPPPFNSLGPISHLAASQSTSQVEPSNQGQNIPAIPSRNDEIQTFSFLEPSKRDSATVSVPPISTIPTAPPASAVPSGLLKKHSHALKSTVHIASDEDDSDEEEGGASADPRSFLTPPGNAGNVNQSSDSRVDESETKQRKQIKGSRIGVKNSLGSSLSHPSQATFKSDKSGAASDMTEEGMIYKLITRFNEYKEYIFSTSAYQFFLWVYESTYIQIYICTAIHILVLAGIAIILKFCIGTLVSSILYYNLVHAVAGLFGKMSFAIGLRSAQLVSREFMARNLIKRGKGISLTSMTNPIPVIKFNAEEGKTLRYIFLMSLLLIECSVWFLGIQMEWQPSISPIGEFGCTRVKYTTTPNFTEGLGNYLQGDSDLALVYDYGLPLGDGVVGGVAAWPHYNPSKSFNIEGDGVGFAVSAVCGDLQLALNGTENGLTQFRILDKEMWSTMLTLRLQIQFPAGSHAWQQFADHDITQVCDVQYIMGDAHITMSFLSDQWDGIASYFINSVKINNLIVPQYGSKDIYFGRVQDAFTINSKYENIIGWVSEGVDLVFNDRSYGASQGATFCNFFQWATLPDGLYHFDATWKGASAAIAMMAHYMLLQYDKDSASEECMYSGAQGAGIILCPQFVITLTASALVICLLAELSQLFWWFLLSGGGEKNDRAAKLLYSPLQLIYDLRGGGTEVLGDLYGENHSPASIIDHYEEVNVRFGESRHTRPNPIGMLILGAPGEVMAMNDKREYY